MDISYKQLTYYFKKPLTLEATVNYLTQMGVEVESVDRTNPEEPRLALEITPNRPDLNNYLGLTREISGALRDDDFIKWPSILLEKSKTALTPNQVVNDLKNPTLCPRYYLREIHGITLAPSPDFIQKTLSASGIGIKNNVVDIINFVMLETGQPMHACDQKALHLPIHIQESASNKKLTTLDGIEREITPHDILITDSKNTVLAIGGVMGSQIAEIQPQTESIYIECAYFSPITIRKTAKRLGLTTDSSRRFELGADPCMMSPALERATELLLQYTGGKLGNTYVYDNQVPAFQRDIMLNLQDIPKQLGINPDEAFIESALRALGFIITKPHTTQWTVSVPSFRQYDVKSPQCLIEEIAKVYDYNKIPNHLPQTSFNVRKQPRWLVLKNQSETFFTSRGFHQAINFSFTSEASVLNFKPEEHNEYCRFISIEKPLNQDLTVLRTSLIPGLLTNYQYNKNHGITEQSFFEIGKRFWQADHKIHDEEMLCGLWVGSARENTWRDHSPAADFHDMKALLWGFLHYIGLQHDALHVKNSNVLFFAKEEQAQIYYKDYCLGVFGKIASSALSKKTRESLYGFELSLTQLENFDSAARSQYHPPSKYPSISRDLSVICPIHYSSDKIVQIIKTASKDLLKTLCLADVYRGKPIDPGFESLFYKIEFNAPDRTLTHEELNMVMDKIMKALTEVERLSIRSVV
jgi:phenylalanyl-tRNA synthetase beta chain